MPQTIEEPVKQLPLLPDPLMFPLYSHSFTISGTRGWLKQNSAGKQRFTSLIQSENMPAYLGAVTASQAHNDERLKNDYVIGNITAFAVGFILMWYPLLALFSISSKNVPSASILLVPASIAVAGVLYFALASFFERTKQAADFLITVRTAQEQAFRHWAKNRYGLVVTKEQSRACSVYGMLEQEKDYYELKDTSGVQYRLIRDDAEQWYVESSDGGEMTVRAL